MTFTWELLLHEAVLASLLPPELARFARPISDGLTRFLTGLPAAQQARMLQRQASLPVSATVEERIGVFAQCSPVLHKLGQVLARDQRLSAELRSHLQLLESLPPSTPLSDIEATLAEELGDLSRLGIELTPPALAEASVAVVIPFRRTAAARGRSPLQEGVFKVLKPGIEEQLKLELDLLETVGEHLDSRCHDLGLPELDYRDAFAQVRRKLSEEVLLGHEQRHLDAAAQRFADDPRVQIPRRLPYCTSRVTAMERIRGVKVSDRLPGGPRQRKRLAELIAQTLIARPVFAADQDSLFHGDPHAGNLFLTESGRLAILDWSLVGVLGPDQRSAVMQLLLGGLLLDEPRMFAALQRLAESGEADAAALRQTAARALQRIRRGKLPGLDWLTELLDDAVQRGRLRVNADLLLFRKSLLTLQGVVADVGQGRASLDAMLVREFLRTFLADWPRRWTAWPVSRDFGTRLSNWDLAETLLSYPATCARWWLGWAVDCSDAWRAAAGKAEPCDSA